MDAERWRRIEELFHDALERPAPERSAFLDAACDDPEMHREMARLLAAETEADEVIDGVVADALELASDDVPPTVIGPYRVLERLGEGGLATVYLAERSDRQYRMKVAIKLVKRGMDTAEILRRLRLERQILAGLDHPNVARLLDGGSTEDGRPYVVMEAIDGEPIDQHCDRRQLGVEERLEIFRKVCSAVHAAHRRLVIHRDLKPSNILVTDRGEPKLLDFGIAKVLGPQGMDQTMARTVTGMRWLTPEYASPEQARGEALTTAADVYALGVLLYELLCGRRPFRLESRTVAEIERLVGDRDPPRPSIRLMSPTSGEPSTSEIAAFRNETPERLRRRLVGDLDTLVQVAMRKEPERRYASAQALEDDVRRYLESRPLTARPDTATYRIHKFVRRNRAAVVAAALVASSLVAGIVGTTRALWLADAERQRAQQHLEELEEVVDFNVRMFEIADPGEARGNSVTAREVLDRAAERASQELKRRPAVAARLLSTLGLVHQALGLYDRAGELLEQALERRRQAFGEDSAEVAQGLHELATVRHDQRRFEEALALFDQTMDRRRQLFGERHAEVAATLNSLAVTHAARGEWPAAEADHRRALALRLELHGDDAVETAESRNDLGEVLFNQERHDEALPFFESALTTRLRVYGEEHPEVAETLHNLAATAVEQGRPQDAERLYRQVLELRRRLFPGPHRDLVRSLHNLAVVIQDQDRLPEAEVVLREALATAESIPHGDPLEVGRELRTLARTIEAQGRASEAEPLVRRALELTRSAFGEVHPQVVRARYALAMVLAGLERRVEALTELDAQIQAQLQIEGMPSSRLAYPLALAAAQHAHLGDCQQAGERLIAAQERFGDLGQSATLGQWQAEVTERCGS